MSTVSITQSNVFQVLGDFLTGVLPTGVKVVQGQLNRVSEPSNSDFVTMTPILRTRLAFNIDSFAVSRFVGSISGTTLTVSAVTPPGLLIVGNQVLGASITAGTLIKAQLTGATGGVGTYVVSNAQSVTSEALEVGTSSAEQFTQVTVQLDVHGPGSADNAQIISTLFNDPYAFATMTVEGFDLAPLWCADPRQVPFINGEQQFETRYVIDVTLEINPIVQTPVQFADVLGPVNVINVDTAFH